MNIFESTGEVAFTWKIHLTGFLCAIRRLDLRFISKGNKSLLVKSTLPTKLWNTFISTQTKRGSFLFYQEFWEFIDSGTCRKSVQWSHGVKAIQGQSFQDFVGFHGVYRLSTAFVNQTLKPPYTHEAPIRSWKYISTVLSWRSSINWTTL